MLAKIVAWGPDRPTALDRLARALDATVLLGIVTNLRFLRWLVRQPVVLAGEARTDTLERIWPPDDWAERVAIPDEAWSIAAAELAGHADPGDAWAGGWRLNAVRSARVATESATRSVPIAADATTRSGRVAADATTWSVRVTAGATTWPVPIAAGATTWPVRVAADATTTHAARVEPTSPQEFEAVHAGDTVYLDLAGRSTAFRLAPPPDVDAAARAAVAHGVAGLTGPAEIVAPMPGAVLFVHVAPGAVVAMGDPIVTIEAMKMEHLVTAPIPGHVLDLRVRPADQVARGQLLAIVEP